MLCFLPYKSTLLKRGTGDANIFATILRMSHSETLFPVTDLLSKLLHCCSTVWTYAACRRWTNWQFHILHLPMKGCLQQTLPLKDAIKWQEAAARLSGSFAVYLLQVKHVLTMFGLRMFHALCLSNFARPSFPSFFGWSCWFVAQLNKIAKQTAEWRSCRPCLHLRTNLGPRIGVLI